MKLSQQDWRKLHFPIIALGIALIAVTLLVGFAKKHKISAQQQLQGQQDQLNQARQKYQASGMEKDTIVKYLPIYQHLIKEGFIGEEQRIEWVDSLRNIHQQYKLFNINYSIGLQEDYKPAFALNLGAFILHRSVMELDLSMLHEGDLLTLIDALRAQQMAPFLLRQCEITKLATPSANTLTPSLLASCELDWLTLREPQVVGVKAP